jgi:transcriptional regulator with XRE-family HTH domain
MPSDVDDEAGIEVSVGRAGVQKVSPAALRRQRNRRKLSLRQLSLLSGVGVATISAWESGRRAPSARLLAAVADALEIAIADLVPVTPRRLILADLRHQVGLSQRAAAKEAGLSPSMYQAIETGFRPADQAQLDTLSTLLGVTEGDFTDIWERTRQVYLGYPTLR